MKEFNKYIKQYAEYLEDLRSRLYFLIIFFITVFILGFFLTTPFLRIFIKVLEIENVSIITTSPFQIIDLAMNIGLFFAVLATFPLFIYQMYSFLKTGLLKKEKKIFLFLLPVSFLLFLIGFSYGFLTLYYALKMIAEINISLGVINLWDISRFISQLFLTSALLGMIFQFPMVITFLIKINLIDTNFLKSKRRLAVVIIFIFVSLLPPTDGLSLIVMSLPLVLMYELTIFFNSFRKEDKLII